MSYLKDGLSTWVQQLGSSAKGGKASCEHTLICVSVLCKQFQHYFGRMKIRTEHQCPGISTNPCFPFQFGKSEIIRLCFGRCLSVSEEYGYRLCYDQLILCWETKVKKIGKIRAEGENCPVEISVTLHTSVGCSYVLHLRLYILSFLWQRFFVSVEGLVRYF